MVVKTQRKTKAKPGSSKAGTAKKVRGSVPKATSKTNGKYPLTAYEHLHIGIVEASLDGKYIDVNEEFCRILGYSKKELLRLGIRDCTHEDDYALDLKLHEQLIEGKIPFYGLEKRFVRKDGGIIWVELTRSLVRNDAGKPVYTIGAVLDVSDRKQVERALRESAESLRLATEAARMFKWEFDFQKRLYTLADNFEQVLGFPSGLLSQNSVETLPALCLEEDLQTSSQAVANAIENHTDLHAAQMRVINPQDGQIIWLELNAKIVYDEAGNAQRMFGVAQNITENKNSEEEIRIVSRMSEENPNPVMRLTPDGRVTYANAPGLSLLEGWKQRIGQTVPEDLQQCVTAALASHSKQEVEIEQSGRIFSFTLAPIREAGYVNLYGIDITQRKQAEEWERRSAEANAKFRTFFDQGSYFAGVMTLDGSLVEANRLCLDFCGFTREDVIGKKFWDCGWWNPSPALMDMVRRGTQDAAAGKLFRQESTYFIADGSERYVDLIIAPIMDETGKILFLAPTGTDITERKRMEDAIRKSEARFHALINQATAGIAESDINTGLTYVNPRFCEMLGYAESELLGKTIWELTHSDDLDENKRLFEHMLTQGSSYQFEKRFVRKDGSMLWASVSVTTIRNDAGKPTGGVGVVVDISERKRSERVLAEYARQQEALYQFSDQLHHTNSLEDVYNAALDAILSGLQCNRASILLFDDTGVMRFVAWRGLSDGYRKATEGHSPWTVDEKNPYPLCVGDIQTAELSDSLKATIQEEGIGSLVFIPLVSNGKLIGKFMVYYNTHHDCSDVEIELSLMIARQLAFSVEHKRAEEVIRLNAKMMENVPAGIYLVSSQDGSILHTNPQFDTLFGYEPGEVIGKPVSIINAPGKQSPQEMAQEVITGLKRDGSWQGEIYSLRKNGTLFWCFASVTTFEHARYGTVWVAARQDITERKRAEERLRKSAEFDAFRLALTDALRPLSSPEKILTEAMRVLGEELQVDRVLYSEIADDDETILILENYVQEGVPTLTGRASLNDYGKARGPLSTGKNLVVEDATTSSDLDDKDRSSFAALGIRSGIAIPLIKGGRWVATLGIHHGRVRAWTENELKFMEETAERTWSALERARAQENLRASEAKLQVELADTLQLQSISSQFIREDNIDVLYEQIINAATVLMRSDMASLQMFHPEKNELQLLAWKGFDPKAALFWEWVRLDSNTTCAIALQKIERVIVTDLEQNDFIRDSQDYEFFQLSGIRAVQTTPLISRSGSIVGMISTHWRDVHQPLERELRLLDVLARQAADLIERRRNEEALRASEERYRRIVETANEGIWYIDLNAETVYSNEPMARLLGCSVEEILGRRVPDFCFPEDIPTVQEHILANYQGNYEHFDFRFRRKDGEEVLVLASTSPVFDAAGKIAGALGMFVDVTERKRIEDALRIENERFMRFINSNIVGILIGNVNGDVVLANDYYLQLLGVSRQDLIEKKVDWKKFTPAEWAFADEKAIQELREHGACEPYEKEYVRADGTRVPVYIADAMLPGPGEEIAAFVLDITERKRAEDALKQSEERFVRFMQHLPGLAWIKDAQGRYVFANATAEKAFGNPREQLYGRTDAEIFPPEVATQFKQNDERALFSETGMQTVEILPQEDGIRHYSLVTKFPIPDPDGNTALIGGTAFDITERLQAEEALRESEARFRALVSQATAGILRQDAEGRLIFVNQAFCNMLGYTEQELLGKTTWEFTHPDDVVENQRLYKRLMMEGIPFKLEKRLIRAAGSVIWVDVSVDPVMDAEGRPESAVAVEVDITARKQAEEALQQLNNQLESRVQKRTATIQAINQSLRDEIAERKRIEEALRQSEASARSSEEKLRTLFDLLPVGITFLDPDGKILQMNSAVMNIVRLPKEQLLSQSYKARKYVRSDGSSMPLSEFASARALKENRTIYNVETGIILENGEVVWTSVSAAPVDVADVGVVVVTVDITDTKHAERALKESHRRLRILSQRLVEVQEEERRALARELHDRVGQTLAALNINLIIINGQLAPDTAQQIGVRLNDSMKLVAETIALVRDVMTDLRPAVLDDYGLEAALESQLSKFTSRYNIKAAFEKPEHAIPRLGPSVEMTLLRIAQEALMNIARHAQAELVTLSLRQTENDICLSIHDDGIGIESWQDANRPGSHGLTIMRERADAFGGKLRVSSVPGQGTTVEVTIPFNNDDQEKVEEQHL